MNNTKLVGIDSAKTVFQLCGVDRRGKRLFTKRVTRGKLVAFVESLPKETVLVMEACATSHHWGRLFSDSGYTVKLISPQFVKPFVKGNKNDTNDSFAIAEAGLRPSMRFVPLKSREQQDIQSFHRARSLAVKNRTACANQLRGLLAE